MERNQANIALKRSLERGMTMVEMMVALLISSLVIFGIVNIYRFANNDWTDATRVEKLQHDTQTAMGFLQRDVQEAAVTTQIGATTFQAPISITSNGYGVIIVDNIGTSGAFQYEQVNYQLTTNGQLQRSCIPYSYSLSDPSLTTLWTTLCSYITVATAPFSVSTFNVNSLSTYDITSVATYTHPSLTIGTLTIQEPNSVRTPTMSGAIATLQTTFTMRGDANAQITSLQEGAQ
jgi:prepilin-type N-terminal cleavage/methylation domain-containing protein